MESGWLAGSSIVTSPGNWIQNIKLEGFHPFSYLPELESRLLTKMGVGKFLLYLMTITSEIGPRSPYHCLFDGSISSGILAANLGIKRFQEDFHLNDTWFPC